jgi:hypothetical protein
MSLEYQGRFANITIDGGEVRKGFYTFAVVTDEVAANGSELDGIEDRHSVSIPLSALRARADANQSSVSAERDLVIAAAITRAESAFRDAVDAEALG